MRRGGQARLCEHIAFCEPWHERLDRGDEPDASEFDPYMELIESAAWLVRCSGGVELQMAGGPTVFDGQATWNHPEVQPPRELAAARVGATDW